ncbi:toll-like receptor 13 [Centroberyx affinis]|uniref:toll-like receptor 13 n=1 Tax=Centroberyx affinis TaxID=166261 RepID=UPI003A5C365A
MVKYFRSLESFVYISKLSAKTVDLSKINQLVHLKKLVLKRVDLLKQNSADTVFHNLTKLEFLHLSECRINMLEGSLTKDLKSVRTISLWIRNTYNILFSFTENLSSLEYLSINNFEIFCSCENAWFIEWAKTQRQVEVLILSPPILEELTCLSDNGLDKPNFVKYSEAMCTTEYGFVLFASTGLGVSAFMLLILFHRLAGPYLLPLYHITLAWLSEAMRSNRRRHYHYDAFVSYSGKDERWLGKDIVENITDSLYQSRHTVCLVSRRYLKSKWCSLEMRLATYRLQAERRDVLILVFLEKISPRQLSTHHRLARLVKTRTYLDWPHDPGQHKAFWDRLWAKLRPATEG